jgi:protein phosphatase PTC2/3
LHVEIVKAFTTPADAGRPPLIESYEYLQTVVGAINEAFAITDEKFKQAYPNNCKTCGSTAVVCLIIGSDLICCNLGDARAVLCRDGEAFDLSVDYKASRKDEQERIKS